MATQTFDQIQQEMAKVRTQYGQRVAEYPNVEQNLRNQIYGQDKILPALQVTKDKSLMELWEHDKRLANTYSKPESNMFIRDPYKRDALIAQQHQSTLGSVSDLTRLAENRQNVLGDVLERGVKIFELGLTALSKEHDMLNSEADNLLKSAAAKSSASGSKATKDALSQSTLSQLFNSLAGYKQGYQERETTREGRAATLDDVRAVPRSQNEELYFEQLPEGGYKWQMRPGGSDRQQPAPPEGDLNEIFRKLGAAATAITPDDRVAINDIVESLSLPKIDNFPINQWTTQAGVAGKKMTPEIVDALGLSLRNQASGVNSSIQGLSPEMQALTQSFGAGKPPLQPVQDILRQQTSAPGRPGAVPSAVPTPAPQQQQSMSPQAALGMQPLDYSDPEAVLLADDIANIPPDWSADAALNVLEAQYPQYTREQIMAVMAQAGYQF